MQRTDVNPAIGAILKALPTFSNKDLVKIKIRVDALVALTKPKMDDPFKEDWLLDGVIYELEVRGLGRMTPRGVGLARAVGKPYVHTSATVRAFLEKQIPEMSKAEKLLLGRLCAAAHATMLSKYMIVSFDGMVRDIGRVPVALEMAYPGYIKSGLLSKILRRKNDDVASANV